MDKIDRFCKALSEGDAYRAYAYLRERIYTKFIEDWMSEHGYTDFPKGEVSRLVDEVLDTLDCYEEAEWDSVCEDARDAVLAGCHNVLV